MDGTNKLECFSLETLSSLVYWKKGLVLFVSYKGNEVLWILSQKLYSQHFIFLVTYEWP
jgi:hypothetical protein